MKSCNSTTKNPRKIWGCEGSSYTVRGVARGEARNSRIWFKDRIKASVAESRVTSTFVCYHCSQGFYKDFYRTAQKYMIQNVEGQI